jgi:glycosyltransferase involved in cell wall biosynthesis
MIKEDLRVLLISPLPPPAGGIASWTKQYIEWSEINSLCVDIVNTALLGKRADKINHKTRIMDEIKRTKNIIKELDTKIDKFKPQIIHLNTPCGKLGIIRDFLCARIARKNGIKLIVHYRCNIKDQINSSHYSRFFLKRLANIADINLVLNSTSKQYIKQESNSDSIQIANFINKDFILDNPKNIRDEIKIISFVGHVQRTKGALEIFNAAKEMPEITFKIAGPIADEISQFKKPSNLILMGPIMKHQVKELLLETDVFLFPSYTEGFANVMLEAMATGLPIITTSAGANVDMIESIGGVIIEVGNSNSIIEAVNSVKSFSVRAKMSEWNLKKVRDEYTTDKVMNKLISIYLSEITK